MSTGHARMDAERLARQALPVADPAGALVMAQLATAHAVLALVDRLTPPQPEEKDTREGESTPELTIYRASHDSIVMGLYTTAAEARKHCESEERRSWLTGTNLTFGWIEDEEDGVAELVIEDGDEETTTGYVVTALDVASEYDKGADE